MSESEINGCINHRDKRHVRVYNDYMTLYKNESKAKIIRVLESWTDTKRAAWYKECIDRKESGQPMPEPEFWITMSFQQFIDATYETIKSEDSVKKYLLELEKVDKHIERRVNPKLPYGAPQYKLKTDVVQKALNKLPLPTFIPSLPEVDTRTTQESYPQGGKLPPGRGGKNIPTQGIQTPLPRGEEYPLTRDDSYPPSNNESNITTKNDTKNNSNVVGASESTNEDAASAANTPSSPSQENHEPTPPTVTETSTVAHEAPTPSEPSKQEENEQPKKPRTPRPPKVVEEKPAPLAMPGPDAKWNAETAVQIVEYSKGRRYSETTRKQELVDAKKILEMAYGDGTITRAQFEDAWKDMASWSFWSQKGIDPMIKHLRKDDKIITILNSLKPKKSNNPPTEQPAGTDQKPVIDYDKVFSNGMKYFKPGQIGRHPSSPVTKVGK